MAVVEIVGVTPHAFETFRRLMDASVGRSMAAHVLSTTWHGTSYRATAPGVVALGRFEGGDVRVHISITFPASLMHDVIVSDIMRSMREAGCDGLRRV